jgi:hypothetical protein
MSGSNYVQGSPHPWGCDSHIDLDAAKSQAQKLGKDLIVFVGRKPYLIKYDGTVQRLSFLGNGAIILT